MFAMFTMFRSASLILVLFSCASLPGQEVQTQAELAKKPPYERMLKGADLAKAQELQKKYQVSMDARKFAEAKKFAEELLALRTRIQGADHWLVTDARSKLADVEIYGKLKPEALAELAYARELYQSSSGFYQKGQFAASAELYEQVVTIRKKNLNENHPAYATSLNNLALVYHSMGEYAKAETLYLQTRDLEKKLRGENHPAYATSLNNLAALYRSMGENAKAEPLYLKARDLRKNLRGENHPDYAGSLNNLGFLYHSMGEYAKAETLYLQTRDLEKKLRGENHPAYATSLNNLAALYSSMGEKAKAEPLYLKARDLRKNLRGENHPDYADSLDNLGFLYSSMGEKAKAEPLYLKARDLRRILLGENHPAYATSLNNLAMLYSSMGENAKAEPLMLQARDLTRILQGEIHPDYAGSLNNLAVLYQSMGENAKAEPVLLECTRFFEMSRLARAKGFQRAIGGESGNPYFALAAISAYLRKPRQGFEAMEKNLARAFLDVKSEIRGQQLTPTQQERKDTILNKLRPIESRINILITRTQPNDEEKHELKILIENRRRLNLDLADLAAELSRQEVSDFATIQRAIPSGHALVTWVDVTSSNIKTDEHWACVLKSTGEPVWVQLPGSGEKGRWTEDERKLTASLRGLLKKELTPGDGSVSEHFDKVKAQRIAPLMAHLGGIETLYVVPVNDMAGIPVEPMLQDRTICYVPSGTFLARRGQPLQGPDTILALGDPVFPELAEPTPVPTALPPGGLLITEVVPEGGAARANLKAGDVLVTYAGTKLESIEQLGELIEANAGNKEVAGEFWREAEDKVVPRTLPPGKLGVAIDPEPARDAIAARRKNDALFASLTRGDEWVELPGTEVEVVELRKLFGEKGSRYLTRSEASEQTLDALRKADTLKNYKFLHLATHGQTNDVIAFNSRIILSQDRPKATEAAAGEPLLDNQLLAKEVMDHWNLNASLVTLSACETGLGRQGGGDGLLGFAQSFLLAGARSVCLSLWKVDDRATALLMDRFYRNMIEKKMTKVEALKEAKEWLRNLSVGEAADLLAKLTDGVARGDRPRRKDLAALPAQEGKGMVKPFDHPKFWAGFILIGSPD